MNCKHPAWVVSRYCLGNWVLNDSRNVVRTHSSVKYTHNWAHLRPESNENGHSIFFVLQNATLLVSRNFGKSLYDLSSISLSVFLPGAPTASCVFLYLLEGDCCNSISFLPAFPSWFYASWRVPVQSLSCCGSYGILRPLPRYPQPLVLWFDENFNECRSRVLRNAGRKAGRVVRLQTVWHQTGAWRIFCTTAYVIITRIESLR